MTSSYFTCGLSWLGLIALVVGLPLTTASAQWVQTAGPSGGNAVVALVSDGPMLYAGTVGGGVFRSTDQGTTWGAVNTGLTGTSVYSLVVSGATLYAGTFGGVSRTTDQGTTWTAINTGLTNTDVRSLAVSGTMLYVGTNGGGVFRLDISAPLSLSLASPLGVPGATVTVPLTLTNPTATSIGGIQLKVAMGDTSRGQFVAFSDSLASLGFDASTNTLGDTTRIVIYSVTNDSIPPGTRTLGALTYQISPSAPLGSLNPLTLAIQRIGDPRALSLQATAASGALLVGIRGDVNLDALIDVLDLIRLARQIIGRDPTPDAESTAFAIGDVNRDGALNVQDVVVQANGLLGVL